MSNTINLTAENSVQKNEASSAAIVVLYDKNPDIKERVDRMAYQVFSYCYLVLKDGKTNDFALDLPPNINMPYMVDAMQTLAVRLDVICNHGGEQCLEYEHINRAINAREQLRRLKFMVDALKEGDRDKYLSWIRELENQAMG